MADLTGLNPTLAKAQISDFYDTGYAIGEDFEMNCVRPFLREMGTAWYSPKAIHTKEK